MSVQIKTIVFKSGDQLEFNSGINIIVGPNNAGKSLLLREIVQWAQQDPGNLVDPFRIAIADVVPQFDLAKQDYVDYLKSRYDYLLPGEKDNETGGVPLLQLPNNLSLSEPEVMRLWGEQRGLGGLTGLTLLHFASEGRTGLTGAGSLFNTLYEKPTQPLQHLFANSDLEEQLSEQVEKSFGQPVTLNRYAGNTLTLHLGRPTHVPNGNPPAKEYQEEIAAMSQVEQQDDGLKSFVGILLVIIAGDHKILLIDEPEAFLHPPQAKILGRALAELRGDDVQIIVSTHSSNIIQGLLSSADDVDLSVTRLTRGENGNHVAQVAPSTIKDLYRDPLLKHSSILDGLFYHGVVLCEAEGDCTYYSAVSDLCEVRDGKRLDLHFTHCNGKDRLHQAANSLLAAKVPVAVIADIDMLENQVALDRLITSLGGTPADYKVRADIVRAAITARSQTVRRSVAQSDISEVINSGSEQNLSKSELKSIRNAIQADSGWKQFKTSGVQLLSGEQRQQLDSLISDLQKIGLFLVPVGELESFHPEVGRNNKAAWLNTVLSNEMHLTPDGANCLFIDGLRRSLAETPSITD